MSLSAAERIRLIESTANRLRMVQLDFADAEPDVRQEYLDEVLRGELGKLPSAEHPAFLDALRDRFPSWDSQVEAAAPSETASRSIVDERELSSVDFLVSRLVAIAPTLNDTERGVVKSRLAEAGLGEEAAPGAWSEEAAERLRGVLGLPAETPFDATRLVDELSLVVDCVQRLDQVCWRTWRELAPRSRRRGPVNLQNDLAMFVAGSEDVSRGRVADDLGQLRAIVAALVRAIKGASGDFAIGLEGKLGVRQVQEAAQREGKGALERWELRYWKKYVDLAEGMSARTVERDILQAVASYAEKALEGA